MCAEMFVWEDLAYV